MAGYSSAGHKIHLGLFFHLSDFFQMPGAVIDMFINSPYNRFADVKMLHFFTGLSPVALSVFSALAILTVVFRNFWCRYLCPYGALLGIIGLLCPGRVRRDPARCTGCGKCETKLPRLYKDQRPNKCEFSGVLCLSELR